MGAGQACTHHAGASALSDPPDGNARAIATMHSLLASGGVNGKRVLSDAGRARVLEQQSDGTDLVIGFPCRWGMGFSLETAFFPGRASRRRLPARARTSCAAPSPQRHKEGENCADDGERAVRELAPSLRASERKPCPLRR